MKKILTILCLLMAAVLSLSSCGSEGTAFSGAYWNENFTPGAISKIDETLTYKVALADKTIYGSSLVSSSNIKIELDSGCSYTVNLKSSDDLSSYILTTTLVMNGNYVYDGGKYAFSGDTIVTVANFKSLSDKLMPTSSKRTVSCHTPLVMNPATEDQFCFLKYIIDIVYDGTDATTNIQPDDSCKDKFNLINNPLTYKKYNSDNYVDNEMMLFFFRAFDFDSSYSYNFSSIDALSEKLQSFTAKAVSTDKVPITLGTYRINSKASSNEIINTFGIKLSVNGTFGGTVYEAYYAVNGTKDNSTEIDNTNRHRPIKFYSPAIYNVAYYEMTLATVDY